MAWARLDDRFHEHWKVAEAGLEATGLWTLCLTWASQARRTSPTPGVVPESVIARFAGSPAKGKKLAATLHKVGMFDDKTPDGWPIHDFADYLPKYDAEANRERARRGGQAKAAKQTASKPSSKPLSEPAEESVAVRQENAKQTSATRASVRRNPVPVPSEEANASSAPSSDSPPNAGKIIKDWIDRQRRRPAERVVGQVAKQVGELLDQDFTAAEIDAGLAAMDAKGLHPSTLSSLVSAAANGKVTPIRGDGELTREQVDDILGPDTRSLPEPPPDLDPERDADAYRQWIRDVQQQRRAERSRQALAVIGR